jgi:hypothetical protein
MARWLEDGAAFLILWLVLACLAAPFIGAWLRRKADEQSEEQDDPQCAAYRPQTRQAASLGRLLRRLRGAA